MSKNRVIQNFWGYDYYFFIDDDVELLEGRVFDEHIKAFKKTGIHHFNLGPDERFLYKKETQNIGEINLSSSYLGSGAFTFYTKEALKISGLFHFVFNYSTFALEP